MENLPTAPKREGSTDRLQDLKRKHYEEDGTLMCSDSGFISKEKNYAVVLLDIEGTTTSISFVKDELFPYITKNVESFLTNHFEEKETQDDIEALRQLAADDAQNNCEGVVHIAPDHKTKAEVIASVVDNVAWQMSQDRKSTALKQLQGHMWLDAYEQGTVKGHLYPDVANCVKAWHGAGIKVCIYSSGSVAAQKLLFRHSVAGDLTQFLSGHFDTKIGGKREAQSYTRIAQQLDVKPEDVLFLTDVIEEARAAKEAKMSAIVMLRPGNAELSKEQVNEFPTMKQFDQLPLPASRDVTVQVKKAKCDE